MSEEVSAEEYRALVGTGRRNKYGVAPASERTHQGRVYDSKLEASVAKVLDQARHADPPLVAHWDRQCEFVLAAGIRYVADFVVFPPAGEPLYLEVKGRETREWRLKYRLFREAWPGVRLVVVKSPAEAIAAVQDAAKGGE